MSAVKELYVTNSFTELNKIATLNETLKKSSPQLLKNAAVKLYEEGQTMLKIGDEERAYIFFVKYFSVVQIIKKSTAYQKNRAMFDKVFANKMLHDAVTKAEILSESLNSRYQKKNAEMQTGTELVSANKIDKHGESNNDHNAVAVNGTSCHADDKSTYPLSLTPTKLYNMHRDSSTNLLIMDIRPSQDYNQSHLTLSDTINIPDSNIDLGTITKHIEQKLSGEVLSQWQRRATYDFIILLDWSSTLADMVPGTKLKTLADALFMYDTKVIIKNEPLVLEGGYSNWLLHYPSLTTNPQPDRQMVDFQSSVSTPKNLLDFDYPDFDDAFLMSPSPKDPKPVNVANSELSITPSQSSIPQFDRSKKPTASLHKTTAITPRITPTYSVEMRIEEPEPIPETKSIPNDKKVPTPVENSNAQNILEESDKLEKLRNENMRISLEHQARVERLKKDREEAAALAAQTKRSQQDLDEIQKRLAQFNEELKEVQKRNMDSKSQPDIQENEVLPPEETSKASDVKEEVDRTVYNNGPVSNIHGVTELKDKFKITENEENKSQNRNETLKPTKRSENQKNTEKRTPDVNITEKSKHEVDATDKRPQQKPQQKVNANSDIKQKEKNDNVKLDKEKFERDAEKLKLEREKQLRDQLEREAEKLEKEKAEKERLAKLEKEKTEKERLAKLALIKQREEKEKLAKEKLKKAREEKAKLEAEKLEKEQNEKQLKEEQERKVYHSPDRSITSEITLPPDWEKIYDQNHKQFYYRNKRTRTVQWHPPTPADTPIRDSDSYTMRLKDEPSTSSRGLMRSHSSPDVSKLIEQPFGNKSSIPLVNRSSKPNLNQPQNRPTTEQIMAARSRDLNPVYGGMGPALTGLRNLGNTCYMNSTIQCLSNCSPLVCYFIEDTFINDVNRQSPLGFRGAVVDEFAFVLKALWTGKFKSFSPRDFKLTCGRCNSAFSRYDQQDSQEFLAFLLDALHEGLNEVKKKTPMVEQNNDDVPDYVAGERAWNNYGLVNKSIIVQMFQGQLKSTVMCLTCRKKSVTFDTFQYLTLPLPSSSRCSLQDCLNLFVREEKLSGSCKWRCPRCKVDRDAMKKLDIWKLPNILIIHLNRFFFEGMWRQKLNTNVDYPLAKLNLDDYTEGPKKMPDYHLYAVTNHYGTMEGGHYTAYCKNPTSSRWYKYDDTEVSDISTSTVKSSAAYFLFYSSINM